MGAEVDTVSLEEAVEQVAALVARGGTYQVITLNPEYLFRARSERDLLEIVRRAALITADGIGVVWAARFLGNKVPERVSGIDLMQALCRRAAVSGWSIFLLGGRPGVAEDAAAQLKRDYPGLRITGTHHGYFTAEEETAVLAAIRNAGAEILFVGLGAPAQERWIYRNCSVLGVRVAMGVGGSFDVIGGHVKRAPFWMRRLGLEWLGRLLREPWRWRRMLVLPLFALYVFRVKLFGPPE